MSIPKAFISYSHDSQEHKKWVLMLASRLRNNGIDAIIDQFELQPGDDLPHFMESNLSSAHKILMICSEKYVNKANSGEGGVGYEKMIITSSLMKKINENKIIPIVRQSGTTEVPVFLKSKLFINFSFDDFFESSYDDLVRVIHNAPLFKKPEIGNNPFHVISSEKLNGDISLLNDVLLTIANTQGTSFRIWTSSITKALEISDPLLIAVVNKLETLGYAKWNSKPTFVMMTDKGYEYLYEGGLLTANR